MHITCHQDFASLSTWLSTWNELARGVPFRRWEWLEAWWRNYGCRSDGRVLAKYELNLLAIWNDADHLIGIAPWYQFHSRSGARVFRFLGDGEVCSDYMSILCRSEDEAEVAASVAKWLIVSNEQAGNSQWDRLEFIGVDAADTVFNALLAQLREHGHLVHFCSAPNTWRLDLPDSWDELLSRLSKQHRNRLRRADREFFQSGRINVHRVNSHEQWARFYDILIELHAQRWQWKGLPGAFASPRFTAFHREISAHWAEAGLATLSWLELDGQPLAAEYRIHGDGVMYAYQSGMDTTRLRVRPGELSNMAAIRHAIEHGQRAYDFLRGDEEYKSRWRATPRPMLSVRVIPPHASARLRHSAWRAGQNVKQWIKRSATLAGLRKPASGNRQPMAAIGEEP